MNYETQTIEALLRNYSTIEKAIVESGDEDLRITKVEMDVALRKLQGYSVNLYNAVVGVFVIGTPIQEHAKDCKISKRQVHRRLDDGLHLLVMIMNGEVL